MHFTAFQGSVRCVTLFIHAALGPKPNSQGISRQGFHSIRVHVSVDKFVSSSFTGHTGTGPKEHFCMYLFRNQELFK
jgi:hypothetical protein